ncbi:MAG: flagellar hook-length control protein FliK [Actinobacteria bacterium]|nr:MAG: flagellar hook-length control protein FliK [Actinomycetota bacterium]
MAEPERVRIEIAFDGGQIMGALVTPAAADALEQALGSAEQLRAGTGEAALALDAEDGRYTIALRRVVYVKRFARESRVGFGSAVA